MGGGELQPARGHAQLHVFIALAAQRSRTENRLLKTIPLTKGKVALVDDEDYERVSQFKWCASQSRHQWYALRRLKGTGQPGRKQKLHQFILGVQFADHRN